MRRLVRPGRTTPIKVGSEVWQVPLGFGTDYRRRLDSPSDPDRLIILLHLVGYTASVDTVTAWPMRRRIEAEAYAERTHLIASDNILQPHPRPEWMGKPWCGPRETVDGIEVEGVWASNGPTVLT